MPRPLVEETWHRVDLPSLRRAGLLRAGAGRVSTAWLALLGPHRLAVDLNARRLELFGAGGALLDVVALVPIAQRFGGVRWMMRCPGCGRPVRSLYAPGTRPRYRCRAC